MLWGFRFLTFAELADDASDSEISFGMLASQPLLLKKFTADTRQDRLEQ